MRITMKKLGSAVFLSPQGKLTACADLGGLHAAVREISDREVRWVLLDLGGVTRLDCSGIGQLVALRGHLDASGRAFGLVNVDGDQRRLLDLLRLTELLGVHGGWSQYRMADGRWGASV